MLGPGQPNPANSGLGVAAYHIAQHLAPITHLKVLQPATYGNSYAELFSEEAIVVNQVAVNTSRLIAPYAYTGNSRLANSAKLTENELKDALKEYSQELLAGIEQQDFDVIYAHDWINFEAALALKQAYKKPLVVHLHSLDYDRSTGHTNSWIYQLEKQAMHQAEAIVAVSKYTASIIKEEYGINSAVDIVPNGIAMPASFQKIAKPFPEKLILFVGRLTEQKGPEIFLKIAQKVNEQMPDTRFVMAGQGDLLKKLISSGAYRKLARRFHFTGHIGRNDLYQIYAMADVYCMPSVSEPFGLSALEAAGFGLPVVLSRQSGAAEVLPGAFVADYWQVNELAEKVVYCLINKKPTSEAVALNKAALSATSWPNTAKAIAEILQLRAR